MRQSETGVYYILNIINGHCYVGSSALGLDDRWSQHKSDLRKNKHDNQHLRNAWNKYGAKNFIFVVLEIVEPLKCLEREQFYIDNIKPEYNICKIAGSPLGYKHTIESKLKMSINAKKHNLSRKIPIQQLNKKTKTLIKVWDSMSDAAQNIIENNNYPSTKLVSIVGCIGICCKYAKKKSAYGFVWRYNNGKQPIPEAQKVPRRYVPKIFSIETRKKISLSKMGNKNPMFGKGGKLCPMFGRSGKLAPGSKPVICKNLKDNTIQEFDCIKNCAEFLGIRDTCLNSILRLRKKIKPKMRKKPNTLEKLGYSVEYKEVSLDSTI